MAQAPSVSVSGSKLDNRRVLSALIDLAVVGAGWAVILAAAGVLGESASEVGAPLAAVGLGWALYYYFACESGAGQTLGKRVMKIRVVGTDGAPAGMREIALRTLLRLVDGLFLYLVGLIVMLATGERRGRLGDLVANTMIVSAEEAAPAAAPTALAEAREAPRVPIAESGPAFEPDVASPSLKELASDVTAVTEAPEREPEPAAQAEEQSVVEDEEQPVVETEEQPVKEADEEAVSEAEEQSVLEADEEQPVAEVDEEPAGQPVAGADEEPVAEAGEEEDTASEAAEPEPVAEVADEPVSGADEEPVAAAGEEEDTASEPAEPDPAGEEMRVKSVETVSAIDLVMDEDDEEAVAGPQPKARQS
jgi:uncharacterized RDD family membrane protein YckC